MSEFAPFIVAGLAAGSVYGLTAAGLVLTYRTSGVFNFAHGALAAAAAYLFHQVREEWGMPWPVALVVAVGIGGPVAGIGLEAIARRLGGASTVARVVATVGLLIATQGLLTWHYGATPLNFPTFLPTSVHSVGSVHVGTDQVLVFVIGIGLTAGLAQYLRRTRTGTAMRGVVDDPALLDLAGTDPLAVRRRSWMIGAALAALSGVLLAPVVGLDPTALTLLVIQAFGAAAIGRFTSLPLTFVGGLVIGVGASLSSKYVADLPALSGLPASLPFLVLFATLLLTRRGQLVEVGRAARSKVAVSAPRPRSVRIGLGAAAVLLVVLVPDLAGARLPVFTTAAIHVLLFASLRLLIVTSDQVSLCHITFAAVGATTFSHLTTGVGLPWVVALVLAGALTIPIGVIVAVPAIRLSGVYLALATFGFAVLVERLVFPLGVMFGRDGQAVIERPALGFIDATSDRGFFYLAAVVVALGLLGLHLLERSRLGRLLRAMAGSPLALTTLGAGVNTTRMLVFAFSAAVAGVAGALLGAFSGSTNGQSFSFFNSLILVVILVVAGRSEIRAPVLAAVALHVVPAYVQWDQLTELLPVAFGVSAVGSALLSTPGERTSWARRGRGARRRVPLADVRRRPQAVTT